ncbi:recombinase family protein [Oceanobacillus senegalensis]|uniref:recombinase family protein n=1 Tax=Oceanobacillus senegalensis TaxID=1936063 RepID=UPI000A30EED4
MATIGYARGSTTEDLEFQMEKLKEYGCDKICKEKIAIRRVQLPELERTLKYLRPGDKLVAYKMDCLAGSTYELHRIANSLQEQDIGLEFIKEKIDFSTPSGKTMFTMLGTIVDFERDLERNLINKRTKEGRERVKSQGRQLGRKEKDERDIKKALKLYFNNDNNGLSITEIEKMTGVPRSTIYAKAKEMNAKGYDKLTDLQKRIFNQTHPKHLESMKMDKRKEYDVQNIKKIKWDSREKCIKVYFKNGDWYHYFRDYTWD